MNLYNTLWDELILVANEQRLVTYSELCNRLNRNGRNIRTNFLGQHLTKIATMCIDRNLPILSALVVKKDSKTPGPGYYKVQREYRGENPSEKELWETEVKRVFVKWEK